jgi:hypothetical protein
MWKYTQKVEHHKVGYKVERGQQAIPSWNHSIEQISVCDNSIGEHKDFKMMVSEMKPFNEHQIRVFKAL